MLVLPFMPSEKGSDLRRDAVGVDLGGGAASTFHFTISKMLRLYFRFHRGLIKQLCRISHQCVSGFCVMRLVTLAARARHPSA